MRSIRTDLAMESHSMAGRIQGVQTHTTQCGEIEKDEVRILTKEASQALGRPCGRYITLSCAQRMQLDPAVRMALGDQLAQTLAQVLPEQGDVLVVGLGNRRVTADALGPRVVDATLVTRHIRTQLPETLSRRLRTVSAVAPGVLGVTGMETAEVIRGVIEHVRPSAVIAVDALAARDSSRICSTIQIADTGIAPGSGVGNHRLGLTQETLGVPVYALGVPMVVYAASIARDAIEAMLGDEMQGQQAQPLGAIIDRVVSTRLGDLVVTPREVDALIEHMADVLARALNRALHSALEEDEIDALMH
jgi:spore protease